MGPYPCKHRAIAFLRLKPFVRINSGEKPALACEDSTSFRANAVHMSTIAKERCYWLKLQRCVRELQEPL
jgi:hypothetical protein